MIGPHATMPRAGRMLLLVGLLQLCRVSVLGGVEVTLKNGMRLRGRPGHVSKIGANPLAVTSASGQLIRFFDDGLRRTFVSFYQIDPASIDLGTDEPPGIEIPQRVARSSRAVGSVGRIEVLGAFDEYGRRNVRLWTPRGAIVVTQGITEITPVYTKVEGIVADRSFQWDTRIATSSIPQAQLSAILRQALDQTNANDRLSIVAFYVQCERYDDALRELKEVIRDFPKLARLSQQEKEIQQAESRQILRELRRFRDAGQYRRVLSLLTSFPNQGVAQDILLEVGEMTQEYEKVDSQIERATRLLETTTAAITDPERRKQTAPILEEISQEIGRDNLNRMADFLRLADDQQLGAEQKLSLAVSGWLLGSGAGIENLAVSLSLVDVRNLVRRYLATNPNGSDQRAKILEQLQGLEGSSPDNIAKIIGAMKPPLDEPAYSDSATSDEAPASPPPEAPIDEAVVPNDLVPGMYRVRVPAAEGEPAALEYWVQLPPEYDPYRMYPAVVSLHALNTTPRLQIDWWAGTFDKAKGQRMGQATRHGYIVVAPRWSAPRQREYGYSGQEHAAVLGSLRDAFRRFAIDTDRVFLSGHSAGGNAAWDIGLAHPDLWAGVIPIAAEAYGESPRSPQYVTHHWPNAKYVPLYFVNGERDGNKLSRNGPQFDRYLRRTGFDTIVVDYLGRGHEHFQDEIHRLFEWMELHRRDFLPTEFECASLRPERFSFFWWAELYQLPGQSMVSHLEWPVRRPRPATIEGKITAKRTISLTSGAAHTTLWLTPEMVDFGRPFTVRIDGKRETASASPSADVLLEDTRTRCDRRHPFWAKLEFQGRKR